MRPVYGVRPDHFHVTPPGAWVPGMLEAAVAFANLVPA